MNHRGTLARGILLASVSLFAASKGVEDWPQRCRSAAQGAGAVRILHLGDSHVAASATQRAYLALLERWCGKARPGMGLPWLQPQPELRAKLSPGWRRGGKPDRDTARSLSGTFLEGGTGAWASVEGRFAKVRLHFLPAAARALVRLDGQLLGEVDLRRESGPLARFERELPGKEASHRLEVQVLEGRVRLLGAAFEGRGGAAYSAMAYNGAKAGWLLDLPEPLFVAQIRAEDPDLVLFAFGTNEANDPNLAPEAYQRDLEAVLLRLRRAAPRATLLMVGPPDGQLPRGTSAILDRVIATQRSLAQHLGFAFVDQRQAMGGSGAVQAWLRQGWAGRDLVHMTPPGYAKLARAVLSEFGSAQGLDPLPVVASFAAPTEAPAAPPSRPIYTFRGADGTIYITDNPEVVRGRAGEWIGKGPR